MADETRRIDAAYYDDRYFGRGDHQDFGSRFQRYRVRHVLGLHPVSKTDRVLDLGCAWGTMTFALAPKVAEVLGIDFSTHAITLCRERLEVLGYGNVAFRVADARNTGFEPGRFDTVYAADLFEHLYPDDSTAVAAEAFRVLQPGGSLVVWLPCRSHFLEVLKNRNIILTRDVSHVDYKSMVRMKRILRDAGFEIILAKYAESHLRGLSAVERLCQKRIPLLRRRIAIVARRPERRGSPP